MSWNNKRYFYYGYAHFELVGNCQRCRQNTRLYVPLLPFFAITISAFAIAVFEGARARLARVIEQFHSEKNKHVNDLDGKM